ncbi:MAG: tRNA (adenosine(37)-N6)-threonylcarbamoyltransferase complex ATPase subunit type 1 TsaE [Firmicutes bacterium]|nr:tRNA (adenosine(37)-N6)-threonylcarbamoyltransferase complex ATPase subunit type 1 TsaE [Bacillota bacterium]
MEVKIETLNEKETESLGKRIGEQLFPGAVIYLDGELGAGKTVFARGIALGLGVKTPITSPTFVLLQQHQGRLPFYHFDLYRLEDEDELYEIGLDECLDGDGVSLIEWAGKFPEYLHWPALTVRINNLGACKRQICLCAENKPYQQILEALTAGR